VKDSDALRRIDDHLDGYDNLPPEESEQLNIWLREDPENADRAFQRVMLHVLLSRKLSDPGQSTILGGSSSSILGGRSSSILIDAAVQQQAGRGWLLLLGAVILVAAIVSGITTTLLMILPQPQLAGAARTKNFELESLDVAGEQTAVPVRGRQSTDIAWNGVAPVDQFAQWPQEHAYHLTQGVAEFGLEGSGKVVVVSPSEFAKTSDGFLELPDGRCGVSWRPTNDGEIWSMRTSNATLIADDWTRFIVQSIPNGGTIVDVLEGDLRFRRNAADLSDPDDSLFAGQAVWIDLDKVVVMDADWVERHVGCVEAALETADHRSLDIPVVYEGFGYLETLPTSSSYTHAGLSLEHGGWGWANCWMESGSLGSSIDHAPLLWSSSNDQRGLEAISFRDKAGRRLKVSGGQLRTSYGAVSRTGRDINAADWQADFVDSRGLGADGAEVWISFLAQSYSDKGGERYAFLRLGDRQTGVLLGRLPGPEESVWCAEIDRVNGEIGKLYQSSKPASEAVFFVARIQFRAGHEQMHVWLDPALNESPDAEFADFQFTVPDMRLQNILIEGRYSTDFDEIRLGASYASVSPYVLD